ncbi:MAG TPA: type II secretion system protein GspC [Gammaproteobacteria bacterium]|nr:type II secretion system protein GspC [Gammaproteobacteria bacterium]
MNTGVLNADFATWRARWPLVAARLPGIVSALLVIALAWVLAGLIWQLVPAPDLPHNAGTAPRMGLQATSGNSANDLNQLIGLHLFGIPNAPQQTDVSTINAPETRLNLVLRGVIAAEVAELSRAIIASGNEEKLYMVGENVPGGATIHAILPEKVILRRAGQLETLTLPSEADETPGITYTVPAQDTSEPVDNRPQNDVVAAFANPPNVEPQPVELGRLKKRLQQDPASLLEIVRPQPKRENGELVGYRLYPGSNTEKFQSLGLQSGDLVTAINGQRLTNPSQSLQIMQSLDGGQAVTLTVRRNGRIEQIVIPPSR